MSDKVKDFEAITKEVRRIHAFGGMKTGVHILSQEEASKLKTSSEAGKDLKYVDNFLKSEGLNEDSRWSILDDESANEILSDVIARDLKDNKPSPNTEKSEQLAKRFITLFESDTKLLLASGLLFAQWKLAYHRRIRIANGELDEEGLPKNHNLSPETIASLRSQTIDTVDGGIVGFDGRCLAYIWFKDQ